MSQPSLEERLAQAEAKILSLEEAKGALETDVKRLKEKVFGSE